MAEDRKSAINTRKRENYHRLQGEKSSEIKNTVGNTPVSPMLLSSAGVFSNGCSTLVAYNGH
ncbi:hypothetical protein C2845_PM18G07510 [Panicum miliaceum]|uniref:Uncharacterized protein n=1 Tax=Panicum miliaceum TaxID=4540 RepID=A0A3L6PH38_PANMI|nr:hypothetical protein C2845_PM18G07510 [Panicum miliaceum]